MKIGADATMRVPGKQKHLGAESDKRGSCSCRELGQEVSGTALLCKGMGRSLEALWVECCAVQCYVCSGVKFSEFSVAYSEHRSDCSLCGGTCFF